MSHHKTCYIIATAIEAQSLLKISEIKCEWENPTSAFYTSSKYDLLISGIGPVFTANACARITNLNHISWINLGIAGNLTADKNIGDIVEVGSSEIWPSKTPKFTEFDKIEFADGKHCVSVLEPIHDEQKRRKLSKRGQLVDMEIHAIAISAKLDEKKLESFKIVSDHADGKNKKGFMDSIPPLMERLITEKVIV